MSSRTCEIAGGSANYEAVHRMFGTETAYLLAFWETIDERFGSFEGFLRDGLGLSGEDIEAFRTLYLR